MLYEVITARQEEVPLPDPPEDAPSVPGGRFLSGTPSPPARRREKGRRPHGGGRRSLQPHGLTTGLPGSIPSDPGIRGPLHPRRLRCPPSPYRRGYASVGRLAGRGASILSVHGLFRNGIREAGPGSTVAGAAAAGGGAQ